MSMKGHNNPPKPRQKSFGARWLESLWDHPEINVHSFAIGWMVHKFMDKNGRGVALSNPQISRATGMSESSVQRGKKWLVKFAFIEIEARGNKIGSKTGMKTKFRALIPDNPSHTDHGSKDQTLVTETMVLPDHSHTDYHHSHTDHGNHSHSDRLTREEYSGSNSGKENKQAYSELDSSGPLNGSTNAIVCSLAEWAFEGQFPYEANSGQKPPEPFFKDAGITLNSMITSCGAPAVMKAHSDMMVKKMNNELVGNRLKLFAKIASDYRKDFANEKNWKSKKSQIAKLTEGF